jgi:hypothetical protein
MSARTDADSDAAHEPEKFSTMQDVLARTKKRGAVRLPTRAGRYLVRMGAYQVSVGRVAKESAVYVIFVMLFSLIIHVNKPNEQFYYLNRALRTPRVCTADSELQCEGASVGRAADL